MICFLAMAGYRCEEPFLEESDDIRQHELMYDYAQASALSVDDSRQFIAEVLESVS